MQDFKTKFSLILLEFGKSCSRYYLHITWLKKNVLKFENAKNNNNYEEIFLMQAGFGLSILF